MCIDSSSDVQRSVCGTFLSILEESSDKAKDGGENADEAAAAPILSGWTSVQSLSFPSTTAP